MGAARLRRYRAPELERLAHEFLEKHLPGPPSPPIDIELLVERLGFEIFPLPGLRERFSIDGVLLKEPRTGRFVICVDAFMVDERENRYRFTLAEELSHSLLHGETFRGFGSIEGAVQGLIALDPDDYQVMEWNAKFMAGALLMPTALLDKVMREWAPGFLRGREFVTEGHLVRDVARGLTEIFAVSEDAASRRLRMPTVTGHAWLVENFGGQIKGVL